MPLYDNLQGPFKQLKDDFETFTGVESGDDAEYQVFTGMIFSSLTGISNAHDIYTGTNDATVLDHYQRYTGLRYEYEAHTGSNFLEFVAIESGMTEHTELITGLRSDLQISTGLVASHYSEYQTTTGIVSSNFNTFQVYTGLNDTSIANKYAEFQTHTGYDAQHKEYLLADGTRSLSSGSWNVSGGLQHVDYIDFCTDCSGLAHADGRLHWNDDDGTLELDTKFGSVLQIGQEEYVIALNNLGYTVTNGTVVYCSGAQGSKPVMGIADNTDPDIAIRTIGVVTADIEDGRQGPITTFGLVRGINTNGCPDGSVIWLGTGGTFTSTRPTSPSYQYGIGVCLRENAEDGVILVRPTLIPRMSYLSDTYVSGIQHQQVLRWNSGSARYENNSLTDLVRVSDFQAYTGAAIDRFVDVSGDTMEGDINMNGHDITGLNRLNVNRGTPLYGDGYTGIVNVEGFIATHGAGVNNGFFAIEDNENLGGMQYYVNDTLIFNYVSGIQKYIAYGQSGLRMRDQRIRSLGEPIDDYDAVRLTDLNSLRSEYQTFTGYANDEYLNVSGDTMYGDIDINHNNITNLDTLKINTSTNDVVGIDSPPIAAALTLSGLMSIVGTYRGIFFKESGQTGTYFDGIVSTNEEDGRSMYFGSISGSESCVVRLYTSGNRVTFGNANLLDINNIQVGTYGYDDPLGISGVLTSDLGVKGYIVAKGTNNDGGLVVQGDKDDIVIRSNARVNYIDSYDDHIKYNSISISHDDNTMSLGSLNLTGVNNAYVSGLFVGLDTPKYIATAYSTPLQTIKGMTVTPTGVGDFSEFGGYFIYDPSGVYGLYKGDDKLYISTLDENGTGVIIQISSDADEVSFGEATLKRLGAPVDPEDAVRLTDLNSLSGIVEGYYDEFTGHVTEFQSFTGSTEINIGAIEDRLTGLEIFTGYAEDTYVKLSGSQTIEGDIVFADDVTFNKDVFIFGTGTIVNAESVMVTDNYIYVNSGEVGAGVTAGSAGLQVDRGSATDYKFEFNETSDTFRVGESGNTQAVATREDSPIASGLAFWNASGYRFDTSNIKIVSDEMTLPTDKKLYFRDSAIYISSKADGYLDLDADTGIRLNQTITLADVTNIIPTTTNTNDLGATGKDFKDLWVRNLKSGASMGINDGIAQDLYMRGHDIYVGSEANEIKSIIWRRNAAEIGSIGTSNSKLTLNGISGIDFTCLNSSNYIVLSLADSVATADSYVQITNGKAGTSDTIIESAGTAANNLRLNAPTDKATLISINNSNVALFYGTYVDFLTLQVSYANHRPGANNTYTLGTTTYNWSEVNTRIVRSDDELRLKTPSSKAIICQSADDTNTYNFTIGGGATRVGIIRTIYGDNSAGVKYAQIYHDGTNAFYQTIAGILKLQTYNASYKSVLELAASVADANSYVQITNGKAGTSDTIIESAGTANNLQLKAGTDKVINLYSGSTRCAAYLNYAIIQYLDLYNQRSSDTLAPTIDLIRYRAASAAVQNGDLLGQFEFYGYDGAAIRVGARIRSYVTNTIGSSDMPADLRFLTSPDGSATPLEVLRLNTSATSAVNYLAVTNAAASNPVLIAAESASESNIDIKISPKGTGSVDVNSKKITNLADAVADTDAVPLAQAIDEAEGVVASHENSYHALGVDGQFETVDGYLITVVDGMITSIDLTD